MPDFSNWSGCHMRLISAYLLAASLSGCASGLYSGSSIPTPNDLEYAANIAFAGRGADSIVMRFGLPTSRTTIAGKDVLVWQANTTMQWSGPSQRTVVQGSVGDPLKPPYSSIPYSATISSPTYETAQYQCQMFAFIDQHGVVQEVRFAGRMGACQTFMP